MLSYLIRRIVYMIPMLLIISIISFVIIQLPPGDFLTSYVMQLKESGTEVSEAQIASLKKQYGLDKSLYAQYFFWLFRLLRGDMGRSLQWNLPVRTLIGERLALTITITLFSLIITWLMAIPIGIYSALHQYSIFDYITTFIGYIGISVPNFLLALIIMYFTYVYFGISVTGLFSPQYAIAPWSWAKFVDMMRHIWVPVIIIGVSGTCGLIRVMRGCLLDELRKPYVITARAKGVPEWELLFKYPIRIAINPIVSTIGWTLPGLISGETITAIVLSIPTTGPLLFRALQSQDMYLAGSFVMLLSFFTLIGTLISDILLVWVDPRVRYE